jgi:hypothetical protein
MTKPLHLNIRLTEEQDTVLRNLNGHTAGFETIYEFYLKNVGTNKSKEDKARQNNLKMITGSEE